MVLVTHGNLANEFISAMQHVVGKQEQIAPVCIGPEDDMEMRRAEILKKVEEVNDGSGVVVLTDMFGGTPSNLAISIMDRAPVEIIAEFELWRKIKDWQGSESWVHKSMLSGKRSVKVITPGENNVYAKDDFKAKIIAKVEDEVVGEIEKCPVNNSFCKIKFASITGWVPRQNLYGIYPEEIID